MSWVIAAAITTTVLGGVMAADAQKEQGKQRQFDLERQADVEKLAAGNEEVQRRERLNKILSANIVSAEGNVSENMKSISLESAKSASTSEGAESLSQKLRADMLKREGNSARKTGKYQAFSTLLNTGTQMAKLQGSRKD